MQPPAHFLAGAATARYVRWWPAGVILAVAGHFVLDAIPHFEDASILPPWLSRPVGDNWGLALLVTHLTAVGLAALAWTRLLVAWRSNTRRVAYVLIAGVAACLPDYIVRLWDPLNIVRGLNDAAHGWWFRPYLRAVIDHPESRPLIAFGCIAAELLMCAACAWALFRKLPPEAPDAGA